MKEEASEYKDSQIVPILLIKLKYSIHTLYIIHIIFNKKCKIVIKFEKYEFSCNIIQGFVKKKKKKQLSQGYMNRKAVIGIFLQKPSLPLWMGVPMNNETIEMQKSTICNQDWNVCLTSGQVVCSQECAKSALSNKLNLHLSFQLNLSSSNFPFLFITLIYGYFNYI